MIHHYDRAEIPEDGTTVLVRSDWGVFEWFQRLAAADAKFRLLDATALSFSRFVHSCIELYQHGTLPSHGLIFRYASWDALARAYANNPSFQRIELMLQRGYTGTDFERSLAKMTCAQDARVWLGRISDARNTELDKVMLGSDLLTPNHDNSPSATFNAISTLYTGSSRAKHKLILPGQWKGWLEDLKR